MKRVVFASSAPDWLLEQAELEAMETRGEADQSTGQIPLSDHERDEIDFSKARASVPHARAVKAIAAEQGIDDWLAHYDPTLTVDEHRSTLEEIQASGGRRMDAHEEREAQRHRDAARTAQSEQCDHAEDHCRHGDPEACEFLRDACGVPEERIDQILDEEEADPEEGDLPGEVYGALMKQWQAFRAGLGDAKRAGAAINEIRQQYGQDPMTFDALGDRAITKEDLNT
jgi:hypothetical protein